MTAERIRDIFGLRNKRLFRLFDMRNPYNRISQEVWRDRIVFSIAPDVGGTPNYLLGMGAKKVVVYAEHKGRLTDRRVEWNGRFYIYDILLKYSDDEINNSILVMDCDGYENVVRPSNLINLFPKWAVTIHAASLEYDNWFDTLGKNGFLISNRRKTKTFTNLRLSG
jgi:hypothetical protein